MVGIRSLVHRKVCGWTDRKEDGPTAFDTRRSHQHHGLWYTRSGDEGQRDGDGWFESSKSVGHRWSLRVMVGESDDSILRQRTVWSLVQIGWV